VGFAIDLFTSATQATTAEKAENSAQPNVLTTQANGGRTDVYLNPGFHSSSDVSRTMASISRCIGPVESFRGLPSASRIAACLKAGGATGVALPAATGQEYAAVTGHAASGPAFAIDLFYTALQTAAADKLEAKARPGESITVANRGHTSIRINPGSLSSAALSQARTAISRCVAA